MKLSRKGQVTIPAELRRRHGLVKGAEGHVIEDPDGLLIVPGLRTKATAPGG